MDATDNRLLATQYYGCWVLDLYNRGRPHTSLGPGIPDAPRDRSHHSPMAIRSLITIEGSRSRFSADCTTSIVSSRWPHEPTGGRREFLRTTGSTDALVVLLILCWVFGNALAARDVSQPAQSERDYISTSRKISVVLH